MGSFGEAGFLGLLSESSSSASPTGGIVLEGGVEGPLMVSAFFWVFEAELTSLGRRLIAIRGPFSSSGPGTCTPITGGATISDVQNQRSGGTRTFLALLTTSLTRNLLGREFVHDEAILLSVLLREAESLEADEAGRNRQLMNSTGRAARRHIASELMEM